MDIDDHDFPLVRKNLNIISVLILVLAYTNAKLNSLSFLGIQLELDPHKLYIALFVLYVYFIWRFLTKLPLNSIFWTGFMQYYLESEKGVKAKHNYDRYKALVIEKSERLKSGDEGGYISLVGTSILRGSAKHYLNLKIAFTFYDGNPANRQKHGNFSVEHDIRVSPVIFFRTLIIFCTKHDKFGDYLFPLFPVLLNLGFFVFADEWQGSIWSLWFS